MKFHQFINWIGGNDETEEIYRIYNTSCFIATLFCLLASIESAFASLSPILVLNNFLYSLILGLLFYLSRFKQKFGVSLFLSIFVLIFIYLPILWIFNGGSSSGIPYYIPMFSSFLIILIVGKKDTQNRTTLSIIVLFIFSMVITGLLLLEFRYPEIFYVYENQTVRYFDIIISMAFALTSNYFILRAFLELYYKQLAKAKEYAERLEELVIRDSMTNLYNHAFVISRLSDEIEKAARYQRPLSILMLDIDHFKHINDTYGHYFGDKVLIDLSAIIQSNCRTVDIAARYGGEEFMVLLPETNLDSGLIFVNRLTEMFKNIQFGHEVKVTVSGGITQYQTGDTTSTMIERADCLLYEAKNEGRNRIKIAPVQ